jgi:HD-like signal output (HDOD) protein
MQDDLLASYQPAMLSPSVFVHPSLISFADAFPSVPTMIATRLQLELLLQDSPIDLGAVSRVILSDVGATLQVLRLIGEEYASAEDRPTRMEECIASLNIRRCYEAVCAAGIPSNSTVLAAWEHFRNVAQCAREIASCVDGFSPEEAYIIGLLYGVGKFPSLLGWKADECNLGEQKAVGVMLADYWHLPPYLLAAIREQQDSSPHPRWTEILEMAETFVAQTEAAAGN